MTSPAVRNRYLSDATSTASPAKLLTMLYDRLVVDLDRARHSMATGDRTASAAHLRHAGDIVLSLRGSLDVEAWSGAPALAALYDFLVRELLLAQLHDDAARVTACRDLVLPLREAWHLAAEQVTAVPAPRAATYAS